MFGYLAIDGDARNDGCCDAADYDDGVRRTCGRFSVHCGDVVVRLRIDEMVVVTLRIDQTSRGY